MEQERREPGVGEDSLENAETEALNLTSSEREVVRKGLNFLFRARQEQIEDIIYKFAHNQQLPDYEMKSAKIKEESQSMLELLKKLSTGETQQPSRWDMQPADIEQQIEQIEGLLK